MDETGGRAIIEAALNGGRSRRAHSAVPCTPVEVAAEAQQCAAAVFIASTGPDRA